MNLINGSSPKPSSLTASHLAFERSPSGQVTHAPPRLRLLFAYVLYGILDASPQTEQNASTIRA
jgi:hypothetical protein